MKKDEKAQYSDDWGQDLQESKIQSLQSQWIKGVQCPLHIQVLRWKDFWVSYDLFILSFIDPTNTRCKWLFLHTERISIFIAEPASCLGFIFCLKYLHHSIVQLTLVQQRWLIKSYRRISFHIQHRACDLLNLCHIDRFWTEKFTCSWRI